jgi:hypothetical protein
MEVLRTRRRHMMVFTAVAVFASAGIAYAQVPTAQDIAACNTEAQHAVGKGAASPSSAQPNTKDHTRAADARRTDAATQNAAGGTPSNDPQLAGMNNEGAKDPAYQAAYRTCMRKSGF